MPRRTKGEMGLPQGGQPERGEDGLVRREIRIPVDVYERLTRIARSEDRSVNNQLVVALRGFVEQHEAAGVR